MFKRAAVAIATLALLTPAVASAKPAKGENPLYTQSGSSGNNPLYKGD